MSMWDAIASRGTEVTFAAGDVLLRHGDLGRHCYAIREGLVLVTATSSQGSTVVLGRRGPGSVLGELAALEGAPRSATVRATTDVTAIVLQANDLEDLLREEPELAIAEVRRLSRQLRALTERYAMRSEELRTRLASLLVTHAVETDDPVFRSTREELAGWIGATREATIRALRDLENQGSISLRRGAVEIVDEDQLRSFG
ncbi:MAG: Crp/Fnr family transcriptional regulator [Actinobacteria bacterium]|nr:Crp/Fnr family transcriptional regulator [Actinomycetota bacterium]